MCAKQASASLEVSSKNAQKKTNFLSVISQGSFIQLHLSVTDSVGCSKSWN